MVGIKGKGKGRGGGGRLGQAQRLGEGEEDWQQAMLKRVRDDSGQTGGNGQDSSVS